MSFPIFFLATFLTLPKQLQVTYLGDIFDEEVSMATLAKSQLKGLTGIDAIYNFKDHN